MAKLFECKYKKHSTDRTFSVAATTFRKALNRAEKFVKSNWGDDVVSIVEIRSDVEIEK